MRVLVVEDQLSTRLVARHALARAGHQVAVAATLTDLRTLLAAPAFPFDVVVIDYSPRGSQRHDAATEVATRFPETSIVLVNDRVLDDPPRHEIVLDRPYRAAELIAAVQTADAARTARVSTA